MAGFKIDDRHGLTAVARVEGCSSEGKGDCCHTCRNRDGSPDAQSALLSLALPLKERGWLNAW
jgi:hypothetical protein